MLLRDYDPARDKDATHRIWKETGWLKKDHEEAMDLYVAAGRAVVAEVDGQAESLVCTMPGVIRYQAEDLPFSACTGVTTSRVARKQGFAGRLLARILAQDVADGAVVAGLGMFEQGFYNKLGFGTNAYVHWVSFDPAHLRVPVRARVPKRLGEKDGELMHAARLVRLRGHGACSLLPSADTVAEVRWSEDGFGVGYFDGPKGELTHHLWAEGEEEAGPYRIKWMSYQTYGQFLELMALIHSWGDQVHGVSMGEPAGIMLQDLMVQPFKGHDVTRRGEYEVGMRALAPSQTRILDLPACLRRTRLQCETVRFNLSLTDPVERYLADDAAWRGVAGEYVVTLGPQSGAERGASNGLPTLAASVNAFTRLWLGVLPATSLAVTDDLAGPPELLARLDQALRLPRPDFEWDF